jgi:hypothetical protein
MLLYRIKYALYSLAYPTDPVGHVVYLSDPEGPDSWIASALGKYVNHY